MWAVEFTDQFLDWWSELHETDQERVGAAVEVLRDRGPGLGRPYVDTLRGSRHRNMKELRPRGGHLRVLFAFDPRRTAILLLGGDKADLWQRWYTETVPMADTLYDEYLDELRRDGLIP